MGTKCEDPIIIHINALRIVDDSPVNPRSELQDAISDFNQAVASAQLRGQRLVALLNDPGVVYKASEEELFKVRANVNRITKSAQSVTSAIDRSLVEIITSRVVPRGPHVDGLLDHFKAEIDGIARATLDKIDDRLENEWRIIEECYIQARDPSGSLDPYLYALQQAKVEHYWTYQSNSLGSINRDSRTNVPNDPLTSNREINLTRSGTLGYEMNGTTSGPNFEQLCLGANTVPSPRALPLQPPYIDLSTAFHGTFSESTTRKSRGSILTPSLHPSTALSHTERQPQKSIFFP
ncbi:hypothetical protein FMUND_2971 [Fusarium mundagurra]|uniref:Uncharacterized protein n=1 Tax=Fusarium mundagurra TaxID=1567541 RepID=A0A8H6DMJ7_9HYPO|nr:hypothetical protein FMUND_2971 [Fusarium mundagurra]